MTWNLDGNNGNDAYVSMNKALIDELKKYLGYPPYNIKNNIHRRDPVFAKDLERQYGRTLTELLNKVGLKDFGEIAVKIEHPSPDAALKRSYKAIYQVRELNFTQPQYGRPRWVCSTGDLNGFVSPYDLLSLLKFLSGEFSSSWSRTPVCFLESGSVHTTLDSLREEILIMRLSGLL